jgi:cytochrome o ubiquinol oxidase subunit 2
VGACQQAGVLDPQGPIASAERLLMLNATAIMLVVVVPVILATLGFAWWYRSSNPRAVRSLDESYEGRVEFVIWSIPALVVILLGGVTWISSHQLDPRAPIPAEAKPLKVEVVALDWKWLFIYPDEGIASVNQLVIPAKTPVDFRLTSATVMNSFFVPQLGSQIYAMGGMVTHLNLLADKPGEYPGISAMFSGDGFADMRFVARAVPAENFAGWVGQARGSGPALDDRGYAALAKPSKAVPPATYRSVAPGLFEHIVKETASGHSGPLGAAWGGRCSWQESDMLGRLTWSAIPFNEPLPLISMAVVMVVILAVLAVVAVKGWLPYLWREWVTSVDHKRIGAMYVLLGLVMLLRGFSDAIMMRTQQAIAVGDAQGYLPPDHYDQIFSAHGVIMIFFVAMPLVIGLMNFIVPLQLGSETSPFRC